MKHAHAFLLAALAACVTTTDKSAKTSPFAPPPDPNAPPPKDMPVIHKPWTERFLEPSSLIADDVRIEGPQGMLEHVVVRQELDIQDVKVETTPDGLLQTVSIKPGVQGVEIRAQVDNLAIIALRRLTILERVTDCDVLVNATGDAYWKEKQSGHEQRGATLRVEGKIVR